VRNIETHYAISRETSLPFEEAVEKARALLQEAGYGILSEIDVQAKLKEKLDIEREPYLILGACNPPLANEGLNAEPELGTLLPCNVVVYERGSHPCRCGRARADALHCRQREAWPDRGAGAQGSRSLVEETAKS